MLNTKGTTKDEVEETNKKSIHTYITRIIGEHKERRPSISSSPNIRCRRDSLWTEPLPWRSSLSRWQLMCTRQMIQQKLFNMDFVSYHRLMVGGVETGFATNRLPSWSRLAAITKTDLAHSTS